MTMGAAPLLAEGVDTTGGTESTTNFYIGQSSFPHGDLIEITSVKRSADRLVVKGHYKLVSTARAELSLYTTTSEAVAVPTDKTQLLEISRGQGDFELIDPNLVPGLNHVTMYTVPGGNAFAGVYFGTQEEASQESKLDLGHYQEDPAPQGIQPNRQGNSFAQPASAAGPNQALYEYLGNAVEVPATMDARYTKEGLTSTIQLAARNAGIQIKKVAVDDSEYPFLVGVVCAGSDAVKLKVQIKKMAGYEYGGSVGNDANRDGSDTCNVFNIVPYSAHPVDARQQIGHRLLLRQQVFHDRINGRD